MVLVVIFAIHKNKKKLKSFHLQLWTIYAFVTISQNNMKVLQSLTNQEKMNKMNWYQTPKY